MVSLQSKLFVLFSLCVFYQFNEECLSPYFYHILVPILAYWLYSNRRFHIECSTHGCETCQDVVTNGYHCSWCTNTKCNGQTMEQCKCYCHVHNYTPNVKPKSIGNSACRMDSANSNCSCSGSGCFSGSCAKELGSGHHCGCGVACSNEGPLYNFKKAFLLHTETKGWQNRSMKHEGNELYDVVYTGGGVVSLMSAYHLLLNSRSEIRILIIDPRSKLRDDLARDFKVGESTLVPSSSMLFQELGLHDWMIENCVPKHTLVWHWSKDHNSGTNGQQTDYYSMEEAFPTIIPTYQLNRAKLESYLISLIEAKGGKYVRGFARIEEIGEAGQLHHVKYSLVPETKSPSANGHQGEGEGFQPIEPEPASNGTASKFTSVHARQLVDGAGRKFLIGTKKKLMVNKKSECFDIDNASVWVRVAGADYSQSIHGESGFLAGRPSWTSSFYNTNHYMGVGYWIWVIPIEVGGKREISIGVSFHKQLYQSSQFNTRDNFLKFLKANHENLYHICAGPTSQIVDFQFLPKLAHYAKQMVSNDNWYVVGEAAYNADPFYSTGLIFSSIQVMQDNTLLLGRLAGVNQQIMDQHADAYNAAQVELAKQLMYLIHQHHSHLGNAAVMSWRIAMESAWTSIGICGWIGKWILCPKFCNLSALSTKFSLWIQKGQHELLDDLAESGRNIGWMDNSTPGLINIMNLSFYKKASPLKLWHLNRMIFHQHSEYQKTNMHEMISNVLFYQASIILVFCKRFYGSSFFFNGTAIKRVLPRVSALLAVSVVQKILGWKFLYAQWKNRVPESHMKALQSHQFKRSYKPPSKANPW